jgi:hypothetical protein
MEAHVTAQSQTYRLQQRASEAHIRHGQEVRADIPNVRVAPAPDAVPAFSGRFHWLRRDEPAPAANTSQGPPLERGDVFFCNIGPVRVREVVVEGDDAPLPSNVVVEGLTVPTAGRYDLVNVLVRANGDLRLIVDKETRLQPTVTAWSPTL